MSYHKKNKAIIITIGTELLIGQVIDTNSAFIAQQLNLIGVEVVQRIAVADKEVDIKEALDIAQQKAGVVVITGGLGPTADDITKPLLCRYFGGEMQLHQPSLDNIKHLFTTVLNRPETALLERNINQAKVPTSCTVLINEKGTAPGMLFSKNNSLFFSLPGVPFEMEWLMHNKVIPYLLQHVQTSTILHQTIITWGISESVLATKLENFEVNLPPYISLAYLPNNGIIRLRLTAINNELDKNILEEKILEQKEILKQYVKDNLFWDKDDTLPQIIAQQLIAKQATVSTAESCTGGYIAHLLTQYAGASNYFVGAVVAYSNEVKNKQLNVSNEILETQGAVSQATVEAMAQNIARQNNTTYGIAVSGIMGPDGEIPSKPVGTVFIAVAYNNGNSVKSKLFNFKYNRQKNIQLTANNALIMLSGLIVDKPYL